MIAFVDTSVLVSAVDGSDQNHARSVTAMREAAKLGDPLTSNYVITETVSLVQRRFGQDAVRTVLDEIVPALDIAWVDQEIHDAAAHAIRTARRRGVSFVDHVSFEVMRRRGITVALSLDRDFKTAGFRVLPA